MGGGAGADPGHLAVQHGRLPGADVQQWPVRLPTVGHRPRLAAGPALAAHHPRLRRRRRPQSRRFVIVRASMARVCVDSVGSVSQRGPWPACNENPGKPSKTQ